MPRCDAVQFTAQQTSSPANNEPDEDYENLSDGKHTLCSAVCVRLQLFSMQASWRHSKFLHSSSFIIFILCAETNINIIIRGGSAGPELTMGQ